MNTIIQTFTAILLHLLFTRKCTFCCGKFPPSLQRRVLIDLRVGMVVVKFGCDPEVAVKYLC
ncbi:MAG: hypothetical protein ABI861_05400 [Panacibacter sp.]